MGAEKNVQFPFGQGSTVLVTDTYTRNDGRRNLDSTLSDADPNIFCKTSDMRIVSLVV
jgi:hypothetical protein